MLFSHHYKSVDVRVQIKEMILFFLFLGESSCIFLFFSIFIPIFLFFTSRLALDTLKSPNPQMFSTYLHSSALSISDAYGVLTSGFQLPQELRKGSIVSIDWASTCKLK